MISEFKETHRVAALLVLGVVLFGVALGDRDIWDIDEGMHAAMGQTMLLSGDWVTPRFNGEPFFDKPALFNWLTAASFALFGINEFAARLPAALTGFGCFVLTYLLGRLVYGPATGFIAAVVLATSLEFIALSRVVQYDIPFTFFTTLTLYLFVAGVADSRRRRWLFLGCYAAAALAVLTKGPVGAVIPGLVVVIWMLVTRRWSLLREMQIPLGVVVFFVITAPWYLLMEQANAGYLNYFVVKQHFGNFLGGEGLMKPRHPEPAWYFLPALLIGFLPWCLLLPQATWRAISRDRRDERVGAMSVLLVVWLLAVLLFFSAATSKLASYILPLFPAAALLVARYLHGLFHQPTTAGHRLALAGVAGVTLLLAALTVYAMVARPWDYLPYRSGIEISDLHTMLITLSCLFALITVLIGLARYRAGMAGLAAISPLLLVFILFVFAPEGDKWRSSRALGLALDAVLATNEPFTYYGQAPRAAMFYAHRQGRRLASRQQLDDYLAADKRVFVMLRTRARTPEDSFKGNYHVIRTSGNKAIVSNRPGPLDQH